MPSTPATLRCSNASATPGSPDTCRTSRSGPTANSSARSASRRSRPRPSTGRSSRACDVMVKLTTRPATREDAAAIAAIYNEGIADRVATFETEPRTAEQIAGQLADKGERYPTVVVDADGRVIAWASAGAYRTRPAYAGGAEHSVYVARAARGTGAGRAALSALCAAHAGRGFWKRASPIFPGSRASPGLHER